MIRARGESGAPPTLLDWRIVTVDGRRHLVGRCYGHPTIRDGGRTITSELAILAEDETWARTQSRVYALVRKGTGPLPADWERAITRFVVSTWGAKAVRFPEPLAAEDNGRGRSPRPL